MNKFLAILLVSIFLTFPFLGLAATLSPNIESLIQITPSIDFSLTDLDKINLDITKINPFLILHSYNEEIDLTEYHLDEQLILYCNGEHYEQIEIQLPIFYNLNTNIYAVIINDDEYTFVLPGIVTKKGSILFNFGKLELDVCLLFILSDF